MSNKYGTENAEAYLKAAFLKFSTILRLYIATQVILVMKERTALQTLSKQLFNQVALW